MTHRITSRKLILFVASVAIAASVISAVVLSAKRQQPKTEQPNNRLTSIPQARSNVKDLEITNERIVRPDTQIPGLAFDVLNKSNRAVMAIDIASGNVSISKDGLGDEEHPIVLIEAHGTLTFEMTELTPGAPIVIRAATFQDGTDEGDYDSVDLMQKLRARDRAKHKAERDNS